MSRKFLVRPAVCVLAIVASAMLSLVLPGSAGAAALSVGSLKVEGIEYPLGIAVAQPTRRSTAGR